MNKFDYSKKKKEPSHLKERVTELCHEEERTTSTRVDRLPISMAREEKSVTVGGTPTHINSKRKKMMPGSQGSL